MNIFLQKPLNINKKPSVTNRHAYFNTQNYSTNLKLPVQGASDSFSRVYLPQRFGISVDKNREHDHIINTLKAGAGFFKQDQKVLEEFGKIFSPNKSFAFSGDNFGPVAPEFLGVMGMALSIPHMTYQKGGSLLEYAHKVFQKTFAGNTDDPVLTYFCPTGTAAGRLSMMPTLRSIDAIVAADNSHLLQREGGSHHRLNAASVYSLKTKDGKIPVEEFKKFLRGYCDKGYWDYPNNPKPRVISISQPTEHGCIYTTEEVKQFAKLAHENDMLLHMDGSRLFYLVGQSGLTLKQLTTDLGVDMLFLGGSKNKMIMAEAAVFTPNFFKNAGNYSRFNTPENLSLELKQYGKQYGLSMGQVVGSAAQFIFALENDLAVNIASKALKKSKELEKLLTSFPGISLAAPVETNVVLVKAPKNVLNELKSKYDFMVFQNDKGENVARFMTNGHTSKQDLDTIKSTLTEIYQNMSDTKKA